MRRRPSARYGHERGGAAERGGRPRGTAMNEAAPPSAAAVRAVLA
jgi:hypothetical protein